MNKKKIIEVIFSIKLLISKINLKIKKLQYLFVALREDLLSGRCENSFKDSISHNWNNVGIFDIASIPNGQVNPLDKKYKQMILIAPNHIESGNGKIIKTETAEKQGAISGKYFAEKGSVILSKIRPNLSKVCFPNFDCLTSADMYPLKTKKDIEPEFLKLILLSTSFTKFASETSVRGNIPKINRSELSCYRFNLPPLSKQRTIVNILNEFESNIHKNELFLNKLEKLKESITSELLNGSKRIKV